MGNDDSVERSRLAREREAFGTESIMQEAGRLPEEPTLEQRVEILEAQVKSLSELLIGSALPKIKEANENINLLTYKQVEYYDILNTMKKGIEKIDNIGMIKDDGEIRQIQMAPNWGDPKNSRKRKKE